jgi:hypothetical protein
LYSLTLFIHTPASSIHYAAGRKGTIIIHISSHKRHIHPQFLLHNCDSQFNLQRAIHPTTIQTSSIHSSAGSRKEGHPHWMPSLFHYLLFCYYLMLLRFTRFKNLCIRKKRKRKNNAIIKYRHECEPVSPVLIMVSHDAI